MPSPHVVFDESWFTPDTMVGWSTLLLAVITFYLAIMTHRMAREAKRSRIDNEGALNVQHEQTERSLKLAQASADAATMSAVATKQMVEVGQRAFVCVSKTVIQRLDDKDYWYDFIITFKNYGQTPARDVTLAIKEQRSKGLEALPDYNSSQNRHIGVLPPAGEESLSLRAGFTEEEIREFKLEKGRRCYIYGVVVYQDIFQHPCSTEYAYYFAPAPPSPDLLIAVYPNHRFDSAKLTGV